MQTIKNSLRQFIALAVVFIITAAICLITADIYANAFFYMSKGIVVSFCAFLAIDVVRWLDRTLIEERKTQSKKQEIGWTVALLICFAYFLWRRWYHYSLWHIWMVTIVSTILVAGLIIRLCGKWDADRVRWLTWLACCGTVVLAIVGCIVIFKPLTLRQVEEIIAIEQPDNDYAFTHIESSKKAETPIGYYILGIRDEDGILSHGTGRAVLYFGENPEAWRNPKIEQPDA